MYDNENMVLNESDFEEDRYARLRLIPWWDQERLSGAAVMVVGAGALGNELIKNLALLGIGKILIYDIDTIENTNLTRSVLYRRKDVGEYKAEVAAQRACEMNPDVEAYGYVANILCDAGLGLIRRMDVVLGGLDNREARLGINQLCYKVDRPWIDGAIEGLNGFARVFKPGHGACYECTMTATDWQLLNKRKSCALLTHEQMAEGKVPTTPTSSSVIAGIQVQEMLKLLHYDRHLPGLEGKGYVFNGMTHDSYVVEYQQKPDCMCHDTFEHIQEMPWSVKSMTVGDVLSAVRNEMGEKAILELGRDIVTTASCSCGETKDFFMPVQKLRGSMLVCPHCGKTMQFETIHNICGTESFLSRTMAEIGMPPLDIIAGRVGLEMSYYEFTNDLDMYPFLKNK